MLSSMYFVLSFAIDILQTSILWYRFMIMNLDYVLYIVPVDQARFV